MRQLTVSMPDHVTLTKNFVHALWLVKELSHAAVSPPLLDLLDLCS